MLLSHIFWTTCVIAYLNWYMVLFHSQHCSENQFVHKTCKIRMLLRTDSSFVSLSPSIKAPFWHLPWILFSSSSSLCLISYWSCQHSSLASLLKTLSPVGLATTFGSPSFSWNTALFFYLHGVFLYAEDGGSRFLWKICKFLPADMCHIPEDITLQGH